MKYLVVSDSHGLQEELASLIERHPDMNGYIHCGDSELPEMFLSNFHAVLGNNDYNGLPAQIIVNVGNELALVVHSHRQGYFDRNEQLAYIAKNAGCKYVFYGHTHIYADVTLNGVRIMNPGSLLHSRDGRGKTYAIFEIDENNKSSFTLLNY